MTTANLRSIALSRRTIGERIGAAVVALEQVAHATAIEASRCVSITLDAHNEASLGPVVGMDLITEMSELATMAAIIRAKAGAIHIHARQIAETTGIAFATVPGCPPNEAGGDGFAGFGSAG